MEQNSKNLFYMEGLWQEVRGIPINCLQSHLSSWARMIETLMIWKTQLALEIKYMIWLKREFCVVQNFDS